MFLLTVIYWLCGLTLVSSKILPSGGSCVPSDSCRPLNEYIRKNGENPEVLLTLSFLHCFYIDGEAHTRCPTEAAMAAFIAKMKLLPAPDLCGLGRLEQKIDQGDEASLKDAPWIALFKYRTPNGKLEYGCHGSLISDRHVLTAAHCIEEKFLRQRSRGKQLDSIILGEYDVNKVNDCVDDVCTNGIQVYTVESLIVHENFQHSTGKHDIALIRLNQTVTLTEFVQPICLPPDLLLLTISDTFWIAGWGGTADLEFNTIKMKAKFKLEDRTRCHGTIPFTTRHICVAAVDKARTCPGDSGGPLMVMRLVKGNYRYYIAGVLSLGPQCYSTLQYSSFTNVSPYVEWIIENLS